MHSDICVLFSANYLVALPAVHLWGWFSTYPLNLIKSCVLCWISARFVVFITKNEIPLTLSCLDKVKVLLDCSSLRPLGQAPENMRQASEKLFFCDSHCESQWEQKPEWSEQYRPRQSILQQPPLLLRLPHWSQHMHPYMCMQRTIFVYATTPMSHL